MGWVVLGVWIGAVVLAAVVLAFCAYELTWKGRRLASDLTRLQTDADQLAALQRGVQLAVAASRARLADPNA